MTILLPAHKITPPQWMRDTDLIAILDSLNHDDINARMVGGCIRNHYMSKDVYDIDIACKLNINNIIEILKNQNIRVIPTGIDHGTITAHINGKNFEITTLRRDIKTDGRHAKIELTDDWIEDAKRRDFTINALYADRDGSIYDPLAQGLSDLENKLVRFIGTPEKRIEEDALRILRFFRFYADYHDGEPHTESFAACKTRKDDIHHLSDERIYDELTKILSSNNTHRSARAMADCDLFEISHEQSNHLKILITLQNQLDQINITTRYNQIIKHKKYIKNNKIIKFIDKLNDLKNEWDGNIKKSLYFYDRDVVVQGLLILKSIGNDIHDMTISDAMTLSKPIFPIIAADIMIHLKIPEGREVGEKMKAAETLWIDSDFKLNRDEILNQI